MATIKQTKAFKEVLKGSTITKAMEVAGYSETTASTTGKLTNTKGFQELLQTYLDDEKLTKKHDQLLNSVELQQLTFNEDDTDDLIRDVVGEMDGYKLLYIRTRTDQNGKITSKTAYVKAPNSMVQDKALDKAYKLKGSYAPEKSTSVNVNLNRDIKQSAKFKDIKERFVKEMREAVINDIQSEQGAD